MIYAAGVSHPRRALPVIASLAALAALALGPSAAAAPDAPAPHTLRAGHALVAETSGATLSNGWYTLTVSPGFVGIDEHMRVPGSRGYTAWIADSWSRSDPTGDAIWDTHDRTRDRQGVRPRGTELADEATQGNIEDGLRERIGTATGEASIDAWSVAEKVDGPKREAHRNPGRTPGAF